VAIDREALIEAMARSCIDRGYAETTVEIVASTAGCSPSDFHRHFESLEECALAAVDTILAEGMGCVASTYGADHSEWESALRALKAMLELFASRLAFASLAFIDTRQAMPNRAHERYRWGFAILTAMLDRLREGGGNPVPPNAARAAIGGGEALVRRELAAGRGDRLPRILPDLVYSAVVPFLGRREALRLAREARALLEGRPDGESAPSS